MDLRVIFGACSAKDVDKHYAQDPHALLDAATTWLREEYGLEKLGFGSNACREENSCKPKAK